MTGKAAFLHLNGEVKQQASLPERSEHAQELQSMGLRHPQHCPALCDPVALWSTARFTAGWAVAAAGVVGVGQTQGQVMIFSHYARI